MAQSQTDEEKRLRQEAVVLKDKAEENFKKEQLATGEAIKQTGIAEGLLTEKEALNTKLQAALAKESLDKAEINKQRKRAEQALRDYQEKSKEAAKAKEEAQANSAAAEYFSDLSVRASNVLQNLRIDLNNTTQKEAATTKLQSVVAALEKDRDFAPALKAANVSSQDTDGEKLIRALISIRRAARDADNNDLQNKIDQAIIVNGASGNLITRIYGASQIDTLKALELECENTQYQMTAQITDLKLAMDAGEQITQATYEKAGISNIGNLTFTEYTDSADEQNQRAAHLAKGETFLLKGEAYIKNRAVKLLVFRVR